MNDELVGDNATLVWDGLSNVQLRYGQRWIKHKSTHSHRRRRRADRRAVRPYRFYYRDEQELLAEYYATEIQTAIRLAQNEGPAGGARWSSRP